ncbi:Probable WRKY transcription factor 19 (WRKY DNA-binding protein 19), partial [Durusdinium trenchii]
GKRVLPFKKRKRECKWDGCSKWEQGGGYCKSHGGGRRCKFEDCLKSAQGKSSLCIAHGGDRGKRCVEDGCEKGAKQGGYCTSHGGGRRCEFEDCMKSAQGKLSLCIAHGGERGKRCAEKGCEKQAAKGGFCVSHGGGRRCEFEDCMKSAAGKSSLCIAHGGERGKRCAEKGCEKQAAKGGFCVSHGGGRRCEFEDCMRRASGKSSLCVAHGGPRRKRCGEDGCEKGALKGGHCISHGGGRRCEFEDCMRSAAGKSSLCIAHGGDRGKRCAEKGCEKGAKQGLHEKRGGQVDCMRSAAGKSSLCIGHGGDRGKRCAEEGCEKGAAKGGYCKSHGGGRRCEFEDCMKSAKGKSLLCIAHGGDQRKRCAEEGCEKRAKLSGYCKSHGGGRRCQFEDCMKIASGKS